MSTILQEANGFIVNLQALYTNAQKNTNTASDETSDQADNQAQSADKSDQELKALLISKGVDNKIASKIVAKTFTIKLGSSS